MGKSQPPSDKNIANDVYIRPNKAITISSSAEEYMKNVGYNVPLPQQRILQHFFNGTDKDNKNVELDKIINAANKYGIFKGKITLSHSEFFELFYNEKMSDELNFSASQYSIDTDSADYWQRALVFGSTSLNLDINDETGIRYVFDAATGEPLYLENIRVKPNEDNYDLESSDGLAAIVNPVLSRITDPSGIGRKVNIKYEGDFVELNGGVFTQEQYREYVRLHPNDNNADIPEPLSPYSVQTINALLDGLKEMQKLQAVQFRDDQGRLVLFGSNGNDNLENFKGLAADLADIFNNGLLLDVGIAAIKQKLSKKIGEELEEILKQYGDHIDEAGNGLLPGLLAAAGRLVGAGVGASVGAVAGWVADYYAEVILNHFKPYLQNGVVYVSGDGNDTLIGTAQADEFHGGNGEDAYTVNGMDTVFDTDLSGSITFSDGTRAGRFERSSAEGNVWHSVDEAGNRDGKIMAQHLQNSDVLMLKHGKDTAFVYRFFKDTDSGNAGGLGITLADKSADGAAAESVTSKAGYLNRYNVFYPAPNAETNLTGGQKDDIIFATGAHSLNADLGGGNDRVYGSYGADRIYGGAGNDVLNGSAYVPAGKPASETAGDRDLIIGGAGRDLIYGVAGDDVIYSEEKGSHLSETDSAERGDWVAAGEGDDEVYGSTNRDLLTGSEGSDTVFGGAGDDVVLGDGFLRFGNRSQSVYVESPAASFDYTVVSPMMPFVPGILVPTVSTAPASRLTAEFTYDGSQWKETGTNSASRTHVDMDAWEIEINRETGDYALTAKVPLNDELHRVAASGAADFLYGGSGNDLIVGQDGNDYVIGGKGSDILWGDDNRDPSVSGDDYLEGGDGDDKLYGGKGDDTLAADKGRDMLDGGEGYDIYSFESADLQNPYDVKTIVDTDGQGMIVLDGKSLHTAVWTADSEQSGRWASAQGWQLDLHGSRLLLTGKTFSAQIVVEDFSDGMFGLNLTVAENHAPEVQGRLNTVFAQAGQSWTYTLPNGYFTDPDGDTLSYRATLSDGTSLPDGLKFDAGTLTFSGTPAQAERLKLEITASDAQGKSVSSVLEVDVLAAGDRENQVLTGTDGSDKLRSGSGSDVLAGGAGDDTLAGAVSTAATPISLPADTAAMPSSTPHTTTAVLPIPCALKTPTPKAPVSAAAATT
ncbi:hypothetical protein BG910_05550 [Neisseria chenwenguii]|uniref:Dystroglycan-type cadherin-like domain-containing protein n=2 Tax=Neisseria chenwenguii TaxID=1853278 RepID=A0A220S259_9NEIS|nr:hypothetical protein BG910_05550 [Neisseria chenwenguii]